MTAPTAADPSRRRPPPDWYSPEVARIEAEALRDPENIYLAASLRVARRVEALLTGYGIDYVVQVESLGRSTLFGTPRHGAAFYVTAGQSAYCRTLLAEAGLSQGLVHPAPGDE